MKKKWKILEEKTSRPTFKSDLHGLSIWTTARSELNTRDDHNTFT